MESHMKRLEEFPNYLISEYGYIVREATGQTMAVRVNNRGVAMVNLSRDRKIYTRSLALLVAEYFLDPPRNESYDSVINLNGDRSDCRANNLMWRPRWFVIRYNRMFQQHPFRIGGYIPATGEIFHSLRELCTTYGLIEDDIYFQMSNGYPCFHYGWFLQKVYDGEVQPPIRR